MSGHIIDAMKRGSDARYINHSVHPNAEFVKVVADGIERCAVYCLKKLRKVKKLLVVLADEVKLHNKTKMIEV